MSDKNFNRLSLKNIVSKGKFELSCSYSMLVIITVAAIGYILGQFTMLLITLSAGL